MKKTDREKFNFKTNATARFLIGLVTVALISAMFPRFESVDTDYSIGMIWSKEDLIAPFSFPVYKSEQVYQKELDEAQSRVYPLFDVYKQKENGSLNWLDSINSLFSRIDKINAYESELNKEKSLPEEKRTSSEKTLSYMKSELPVSFTEAEWKALYSLLSIPAESDAFRKKIVQSLNQVYREKIINYPKSQIQSDKISFIRNKIEENLDLSDVSDLVEIERQLKADYESYFKLADIPVIALKISKQYVYPDFIFNKEETDKLISSVKEAVPKTFGSVRENERIVSKHEPINELTMLKLESYKRVRSEQMASSDFYIQQAGRVLLVLSLITMIVLFLLKLRREIYSDNFKLILLSTVILFQCLLAYLSLQLKLNFPVEYMIMVPVAALLLTIIFDSRLAIFLLVIICILVSILRGGDYDILIPNFVASVFVVYSIRDIKNRTQIFITMIYVLIGYYITIIALGFERYESISIIKNQLISAGFNALLSPVIAYGLLLFYERVFRVATDLVFLELSDFNHPLLRELSAKAPGTFHHSIVVGNLSEAAAKEIGAREILTRVGCYYHDIGKIINPGYFIENQMDTNKHEELNPSLSAKMIILHVRNGIKLAEKYNLPQEIIDFIPMHHGTNLVSYFYEKARTEEGEMETMHDFIYRYPGPKPQTKETGIVMLADAVEAATRSIEEPTPTKIETQINEIIRARFLDGELDECSLTLSDLIKIKQSFLKTLVGIHHHRIRYPEAEDENENE
ncbi:MAG TPA: HDIG domain-containing protein [Ignavibacteria bacterium]|nr:HDIG domain-containing protein [Ignavibacteria bacterium]